MLGTGPNTAIADSRSVLACDPPIVTAANPSSTSSVDLQWLDLSQGAGIFFQIEIIPVDSPATGVPVIDSIYGTQITITNLDPGTAYQVYMRTMCADGPSNWTNSPVIVTTWIDNANGCDVSLNLADDSCDDPDVFVIQVDRDTSLRLGENISLAQVQILIEHPWVADLAMKLTSPSGQTIRLAEHRGGGSADVGDLSAGCSEPFVMADFACAELSSAMHLRGSFRPEETFDNLNDSTRATGNWLLEVCDRAPDDLGTLRGISLVFDDEQCSRPPVVNIQAEFRDSVQLGLSPATGLDSIEYYYDEMAFDSVPPTHTSIIDAGIQQIAITDINPASMLHFIARGKCGMLYSPWTCITSLSTTCSDSFLTSDFDNETQCLPQCSSSCSLQDSIWSNVMYDDSDWITYSGSTPTGNTGPTDDRTGWGNYVYYESSGPACGQNTKAILQSTCLRVDADTSTCEASFWYFMRGDSVGTLSFEVSTDNGNTWDSKWQAVGEQATYWQAAYVDLDTMHGMVVLLRMVALGGGDNLGDIAIDDIKLHGINPATSTFYRDFDLDSIGTSDSTLSVCLNEIPTGFSLIPGDCDDQDSTIYPGAPEIPCNHIDDNCDGEVDESQDASTLRDTLLSITPATCPGISDGSISVTAIGGTPPYTYEWNTGDTTTTLSNVAEGMYTFTVTDSMGCIHIVDSIAVGNVMPFDLVVFDVSDPTCLGLSDGNITLMTNGGTGFIDYAWSTGDTTSLLDSIPAGSYSVTITDSMGCEISQSGISLMALSSLEVEVDTVANESCYGASDGYIKLQVSTTDSIQHYLWSTGDTTNMLSGLAAGKYDCTVTSASGCYEVIDSISISAPTEILFVIENMRQPICNGDNSGSITASVSGGQAPYEFIWSNGATTSINRDLQAGQYQVTITDMNGCSVNSDTITLEDPEIIEVHIDTLTDAFCPLSSTGSISIHIEGGVPPYNYAWSNGIRDTNRIHSLPAGEYSVTISDANGCKMVRSSGLEVGVLNTSLPVSLTVHDSIPCHGDSIGSLLASLDTATLPVIYHWSNGAQHVVNALADTLEHIGPGSYGVTITDGNGCVGTSQVTQLIEPTAIGFVAEVADNLCFGTPDGEINLILSGGTPPYEVYWDNGMSGQAIAGLLPGSYQADITDRNGCVFDIGDLYIAEADSVKISFESIAASGGQSNGEATAIVEGGTHPFEYMWDASSGYQTTRTATGLASGTYFITITDANSCEYTDSVVVDQIDATSVPAPGSVLVYPNPATTEIYLKGISASEYIELVGMDGVTHLIAMRMITAPGNAISLNGVPAGVFILMVDGKRTGARLVVLPH